MAYTLIIGRAVHSLPTRTLEVIDKAAILVSQASGEIVWVERDVDAAAVEARVVGEYGDNVQVTRLTESQFLFPGFIDTHIHAPQYENAGIGMDLPLLDWLEKYTFPTESSFSDDRKALSVYTRVVKGTLRQGTTFAAYYSSLHSSASKILADVCMRLGQRALVGKCNMNQNSPSYYIEESAEASLQATQDVVDYIRTQDPDFKLVAPIVTPRFAPSCTQDLLQGLGRMAASQDLHIQTHISENPAEIAWVKSLFPTYEGYMDVYDKNGLIGQKTILAHACWLEDAEVKTAVEKGAGVSHCPISNSAISSGEAPIRDMLNAGVKIGLGTDVSGGYSPSILDVVRHAIMVSRHRCIHHKRTDQQLDLDEVLFLATLGGAQVCDMEARLGNFEPGKLFDALLVDTSSETGSRVEVFEGESFAKILEKWAFHGDDRNLRVVWVNGVPVSGTLYH